ncbi:hypothetical protein [Paenibacillus sp. USDA918EY]|uniref:hypothetical protein n=1 Tax=Paenibacillus sp. USDA918EY TaxID=2689575 RepID=UPI001F1732D4|nr:hypothetical protein [Paenibacillus sp. USDA918EY]
MDEQSGMQTLPKTGGGALCFLWIRMEQVEGFCIFRNKMTISQMLGSIFKPGKRIHII